MQNARVVVLNEPSESITVGVFMRLIQDMPGSNIIRSVNDEYLLCVPASIDDSTWLEENGHNLMYAEGAALHFDGSHMYVIEDGNHIEFDEFIKIQDELREELNPTEGAYYD